MAIRAWMDGDLRLALRLLQWAQPATTLKSNHSKIANRASPIHTNGDFKLQTA